MRLIPLLAATTLAVTLAMACSTTAFAQQGKLSSADRQTLHDYTLTESFLKKWEAVASDPKAPTCNLMTLDVPGNSLDAKIANYDARPGNHAYLASQGLTAREMVLGTSTMALAAIQEMRANAPDMVEGDADVQVSDENMAFHRSHKAEVHRFMQKVGQERLRRDGTKLSGCKG